MLDRIKFHGACASSFFFMAILIVAFCLSLILASGCGDDDCVPMEWLPHLDHICDTDQQCWDVIGKTYICVNPYQTDDGCGNITTHDYGYCVELVL